MSHVSEAEMAARREAAAKVARNRQVIIKRLLSHSGVVRRQGSEFGETIENVNGVLHACCSASAMTALHRMYCAARLMQLSKSACMAAAECDAV